MTEPDWTALAGGMGKYMKGLLTTQEALAIITREISDPDAVCVELMSWELAREAWHWEPKRSVGSGGSYENQGG